MLHCGADADLALFDPGGDASPAPDRVRPIDPSDANGDVDAAPHLGLDAVQVVTGDAHSCAVNAAGKVYCWGDNSYGQLGLGLDVLASSVPREVELPPNTRVVQLGAGGAHTCALTDRKSLLCWGRNDRGQLARAASLVGAPDGVVLPSALATATFVGVSAGASHTCAVYIQPEAGDGGVSDAAPADEVLRLACWGDNGSAQLARDDVSFTEMPADVRRGTGGTSGPSVVVQLAALGADFSAASLRVGDVYRVQAWGNPATGVTVDVDAGLRVTPTSVLRGDGGFLENATSVQAGQGHACAVLRVPRPADPDAGPPDEDLDASDDAEAEDASDPDAAAPTDAEVVCWGTNERGELARELVSARELAEPVTGDVATVGQLALGGHSTCMLDRGTLRCAGANDSGQLGIGTFDEQPHPTLTAVRGLGSTVLGASLGARHACALVERAAGVMQVACWGDNRSGQLGDAISLGSGYPDVGGADRYRRATPEFVLPAE